MNLGELRKALTKLPADFDTAEVMLVTVTSEGRQYEPACAIGLLPVDDTAHIGLCGTSYIREQVENGKMEKPKGYENIPPVEGDEWKNQE